MEVALKNNINGNHAGHKGIFEDCNRSSAQLSYLSKLAAIDIDFNDLTYSVPNSRKGNHLHFIIHKVSIRLINHLIGIAKRTFLLKRGKFIWRILRNAVLLIPFNDLLMILPLSPRLLLCINERKKERR